MLLLLKCRNFWIRIESFKSDKLNLLFIPAFFFRIKRNINFKPSVHHVSPPKPSDVATSNFVAA